MNPSPVTLVEGTDPTLVSEALARVVEALLDGEDRSLALEDHAGDAVDLAAVADACATPPFLVGRRVVVIRDIGRWNTEEVAPLLSYLENPLDSTALVLVGGGGTIAPKLAAAVKAGGKVVGTNVDSKAAATWIRQRLADAGLTLVPEAERQLGGHLGEDLQRLPGLVRVLEAAYGPGARLTWEEVEPYVGEAGSVTPWAFTDAIDNGSHEDALTLLHRLMEGGDRHPLVILSILHRHISGLLKVDSPAIRTEAAAAQAMGIAKGRSTFPAKKALAAASRWGSANIAEAVGLLADAEVDLKGASAWPGETILEVLVARLCRLAKSRPAASAAGRSR